MDHLRFLCLVFIMLSRLFIAALWSPAGKGLTSLALVGDVYCIFVTFPCGILGQVWYLILSFPNLCCLSYFLWLQNVKFILDEVGMSKICINQHPQNSIANISSHY